jgi:hypothetical protein
MSFLRRLREVIEPMDRPGVFQSWWPWVLILGSIAAFWLLVWLAVT